jgi:hypothetical protein
MKVKTMSYTFDIAYDCPLHEFLQLLDRFELKLESWITEGPGGGNPEITVSGTSTNIKAFQNFYD